MCGKRSAEVFCGEIEGYALRELGVRTRSQNDRDFQTRSASIARKLAPHDAVSRSLGGNLYLVRARLGSAADIEMTVLMNMAMILSERPRDWLSRDAIVQVPQTSGFHMAISRVASTLVYCVEDIKLPYVSSTSYPLFPSTQELSSLGPSSFPFSMRISMSTASLLMLPLP